MKKIILFLAIFAIFTACSVHRSIKVNPLTAFPKEIMKGDSTTLSWNIEGIGDFHIRLVNYSTKKVIADNLPMQGSYSVKPDTTTYFALYAQSSGWITTVKGVTSIKVEVK